MMLTTLDVMVAELLCEQGEWEALEALIQVCGGDGPPGSQKTLM